jgi:HSP20 family molecular chaperone IbpA
MKVNPDLIQIQHDNKVRKLNESHETELRKLGKLQQHQTKEQLEAIERSKANHQEMMSQLKNDQDVHLATQYDKTDEKLLDDINRKQAILDENKKLIEKDNLRLEDELTKTRKLYKDQLENLKSDQDDIAKNKYDTFRQDAEKFNNSSLEQMRSMKDKYELQSSNLSNQNTRNYGSFVADSEKKGLDQRQLFQKNYDKNSFEFSDKLLDQEVEFQNQLKENDKQNKHVEDQNSKRHQYEIESANVQYQNKIKQEKENFSNRKNALVSTSEAELATIQNAYTRELAKLRENFSKEKSHIENRASDSFYSITTIDPKVSDEKDGYIVSLPLPKHESENVVFTANQRNLKLSIARTFSDDVTLPDGSENLSRKSETSTKVFKVADIVDPKQITRKYEDGLLSFYIKKA